jgi:hypothetical protein
MSFRIIPSYLRKSTIAKGRVTGGTSEFYNEYWGPEVLELYYPLTVDTSFNPGQATIIDDYQVDIENYLFDIGEDYDDGVFLDFLKDLMGEAKYNALSETWEQLAEDLINSWDHSSSKEGFGKKKFFGVTYS